MSSWRVDLRAAFPLVVLGVALLVARGTSAQTPADNTPWQAGAFVDVGSLRSNNSPPDHLFRTRGTTPRVDEININMAGIYLRKAPTTTSRWGVEATAHGGEDSQLAFLYGPHQHETALGFWRWLSNTIVERRTERVRAALDFHVSTERVADASRDRAWWVAAQTPVRVTIRDPWSVTFRPEVAWDSAGRWTTLEQTVVGMTSSVSYDRRMRLTQAIVRFEHRFDRSTGPQGGFFKRMSADLSGTTPNQHLFVINLIVAVHGAFGGTQ